MKHKPLQRYEPPQITKKSKKATAVAVANERQYVAGLQEITPLTIANNENPLKRCHLLINHLQLSKIKRGKQVTNTIRETPSEMYTPTHMLIPPQDKLSLFRKHIPKQQEIDALLQNLRKRVLHNLMVNLDTKDLVENFT